MLATVLGKLAPLAVALLWPTLSGGVRRVCRALGMPVHVWRYRNPAERTCIHCGRTECQFETPLHGLLDPNNPTWWETMSDGDKSCRRRE